MEKQEKYKKGMYHVEKAAKWLEIGIAVIILIVILIKIIELMFDVVGVDFNILSMGFQDVLSTTLGFVIGAEFVKMMCKHTSESVVDLLLFAIARQIVVEHSSMQETLIGVIIVSGLFAVKKFLIRAHNSGDVFEAEDSKQR
ncbi:MAG: transporter [Oscillospiraceae bacterium]|nr:transporter [Oscillospiraceae bacterium]